MTLSSTTSTSLKSIRSIWVGVGLPTAHIQREIEFFRFISDVSEDNDPKYEKILDKISRMLGDPRNYGPTPEEKEEMERVASEAKMKKEAEERTERAKQEAEEESLLKQKQEEWVSATDFT